MVRSLKGEMKTIIFPILINSGEQQEKTSATIFTAF